MKYGRKIKYIFGRHFAWLIYFTYHLIPELALKYKQHMAEVRNVCYSLAELYVKSVHLNLFQWRGGGDAKFMKYFKVGHKLLKFGNL
jgi:hypothetical protein